jgi:hypothetical protein
MRTLIVTQRPYYATVKKIQHSCGSLGQEPNGDAATGFGTFDAVWAYPGDFEKFASVVGSIWST